MRPFFASNEAAQIKLLFPALLPLLGFPDPWEDLKSRTSPPMVPYLTIGCFFGNLKGYTPPN